LKIELTETEIDLILRGLESLATSESNSIVADIRNQLAADGILTGKTYTIPEEDFIQKRNERMMAGTATPCDWNPNDPRNW